MKSTQIPDKCSDGWLSELDSRTSIAKEMRERFQLLTNDLGGVKKLSYQQRSLAERALWLEYWLACQERDLASGEEFDVGKWVQAANSLQGIFSKLGLTRIVREMSLTDIMKRNESKE